MQATKTLNRRTLLSIAGDLQKCAEVASLIYVSDAEPGIVRKKSGKGFVYLLQDKRITDDEQLRRIKGLVIPPAWTNVWICKLHNGHIQCTGLDANNRKQYKYHHDWVHVRNQTKYSRLLEFGKALPALRSQIEKDMEQKEFTESKVIATAIAVMEKTYIRIGSNAYEKLYGSYGLTTLKNKHVKVNGHSLEFVFKGKKGVMHKISIKSRKLAKIIKQCRDIPGKELFQYKDDSGNYRSIDSGMVNNYIKQFTGSDFTAKDFRTWAGSIHALYALKGMEPAETVTAIKKNIVAALDYVSVKLGNTRAVCRKYYVHPQIFDLYENQKLNSFLDKLNSAKEESGSDLNHAERILLEILSAK